MRIFKYIFLASIYFLISSCGTTYYDKRIKDVNGTKVFDYSPGEKCPEILKLHSEFLNRASNFVPKALEGVELCTNGQKSKVNVDLTLFRIKQLKNAFPWAPNYTFDDISLCLNGPYTAISYLNLVETIQSIATTFYFACSIDVENELLSNYKEDKNTGDFYIDNETLKSLSLKYSKKIFGSL